MIGMTKNHHQGLLCRKVPRQVQFQSTKMRMSS